jgi:hypothetical protein
MNPYLQGGHGQGVVLVVVGPGVVLLVGPGVVVVLVVVLV